MATFYNFFTLKPQGRHTCVVCTGTACYIKGADQIMNVLEKKFDLKSGIDVARRRGLRPDGALHRLLRPGPRRRPRRRGGGQADAGADRGEGRGVDGP